jgi:Tfp pilus assembly protein PilE
MSVDKITSKKGLSLTEIVICIAIFMILAGVGVGAYLNYYLTALHNNEADSVVTLVKETRFRSLKNRDNSNYGIHLDTLNNKITSFQEVYLEENEANTVIQLEKLRITDLLLNPNFGATNQILFEKHTGKTQNDGTFTLGGNNFSSIIITVNQQGLVD